MSAPTMPSPPPAQDAAPAESLPVIAAGAAAQAVADAARDAREALARLEALAAGVARALDDATHGSAQ